MQSQEAFTAGIHSAQEGLPHMLPYIASEAAEGVAYQALPTPKAGVLTPVTATVNALYNQISTVRPLLVFVLPFVPHCNRGGRGRGLPGPPYSRVPHPRYFHNYCCQQPDSAVKPVLHQSQD